MGATLLKCYFFKGQFTSHFLHVSQMIFSHQGQRVCGPDKNVWGSLIGNVFLEEDFQKNFVKKKCCTQQVQKCCTFYRQSF